MLAKTIAIFALIATVNGGAVSYLASDPHIGAQAEHTVRGFGGLSSVSQYSKAIDSPFSSVRKTDIRVTNDALSAYTAPVLHAGYASPALHAGYAAPALHAGYAAPALHAGYAAAPALHAGYAAPALHAGYATPALHAAPALHAGYAAPALHAGYAAPALHAGYAAPALHAGYAAPALHAGYAAPAALAHQKIGVAYSGVSPAVATLNFNGYGVSYGY